MATATEKANGRHSGSDLDSLLNKPANAYDRELATMRMENETIMAECRMRPRDMASIRGQLQDLLKEFPEFAEEAVYHKPVGKDDSGQMKYADGLSIRAAEALAEVYGYNRVRADVTPLDDFTVKIEAIFTDFQSGRIWQDGGIVSKRYKTKTGSIATHNEDRFYNVVLKSEKSKYIREVINRSVNAALKAWFENECYKVAASRLDDEAIGKILKKFEEMGVNRVQLETLVGKPIAMGWLASDRVKLLGTFNAIKDGETTISEAFDAKPDEQESRAKKSTLGDDLKKEKAAQSQPKPIDFPAYIKLMQATETTPAAGDVYTNHFGPDALFTTTEEQRTEGFNLYEAQKKAIRGKQS